MNTTDQPPPPIQVDIEDPTTGETHTFTGATEADATAAAEAFFGINEAQEHDNA